MKAIIVAAGPGSRLMPYTEDTPKCILNVGGRPIIQHILNVLHRTGIADIVIVVGHKHDQIREYVGNKVQYVLNPFYSWTNSLASVWFARDLLKQGFLYFHSDIIFNTNLISMCLKTKGPIVLVVDQRGRYDNEDMKVRIKDGHITEVSKKMPNDQASGEFIGIARVDHEAVKSLIVEAEALLLKGRHMAYFEEAVTKLAQKGFPINPCPTRGIPWMEIDIEEDLKYARDKFKTQNKI